jgi:serine phosphatase RsbU (regulator of sigma subunit)
MAKELDTPTARLFREFFRRVHLCRPEELVDVAAEEAMAALNATEVVMYLADHEQTALIPVPGRHAPARSTQTIEGTLAGRVFASTTLHTSATEDAGRRRVLVPILDGTDRMGILELVVDAAADGEVSTALLEVLERYAHAVAQAVLSKNQYGDVFALVQRSQPMTVGAELLQSVLPPSTFATDGLVISAMLEPAYSNGGDAFDYAVNGHRVHLAVFDGMGHGLEAAGLATFAVAAYRHSRRLGLALTETYAAMDTAIGSQFGGSRFVTAVLAELDLRTGALLCLSAGHPPPFLIRQGRVNKPLEITPATPLGVPSPPDDVSIAREHLEPGDSLLLFTDGLTEARQPGGGFLTEAGLAEFVQREAAAQRPAPETLRRLRRAILTHQDGVLQDDATAMLVDWGRGSEERLMPQTVR